MTSGQHPRYAALMRDRTDPGLNTLHVFDAEETFGVGQDRKEIDMPGADEVVEVDWLSVGDDKAAEIVDTWAGLPPHQDI